MLFLFFSQSGGKKELVRCDSRMFSRLTYRRYQNYATTSDWFTLFSYISFDWTGVITLFSWFSFRVITRHSISALTPHREFLGPYFSNLQLPSWS